MASSWIICRIAGTSDGIAGRITLMFRAYLVLPGRAWRSEPVDVSHPDHGGARFIRGGKINLSRDAPVVVARGVLKDLADLPYVGALGDHQQSRPAGVGAGADVVVFVEVVIQHVFPAVR